MCNYFVAAPKYRKTKIPKLMDRKEARDARQDRRGAASAPAAREARDWAMVKALQAEPMPIRRMMAIRTL
jgi:hypothetical protein